MDHQEHNDNLQYLQDLDDSDQDDVVSFSDLPIDPPHDQQQRLSTTDPRDSFDFSFTFNTPINNTNQTDVFSYNSQIRPRNSLDEGNKINKAQLHSMKSKSCRNPETGSCRLSYRSSSSRKHKVFIGYGLANIPTKMELSDIKKRQNSRRNPAPMFPDVTAHGGCDIIKPAAADRKGHRVVFTNLLAKVMSFPCVSPN